MHALLTRLNHQFQFYTKANSKKSAVVSKMYVIGRRQKYKRIALNAEWCTRDTLLNYAMVADVSCV